MSSSYAEWWHWAFGILTACLIVPILASWLSDGRIRLSQKGIAEPFIVGVLGGVGGSIGTAVRGDWGASGIGLCLATGLALLVIIVKSIRGTLITKEDEEED